MAGHPVNENLQQIKLALEKRKCMLMIGYGLASSVYIERGTSLEFRSRPQRLPQTFLEMLEDMADWCYKNNRVKDEAERTLFKDHIKESAFSKAGTMIEGWQPKKPERLKYLLDALLCDQISLSNMKIPAHELIAHIPFNGYIVTTYDLFLEKAFQSKGEDLPKLDAKIIGAANKSRYKQKSFILKLHGDVDLVPSRFTHPILNDLDFKKRLAPTDEKLKQNWRRFFVGSSLLFIGFERDAPGLQNIEYFFEQKLFDTSEEHWIVGVRYPEDSDEKFSVSLESLKIVTKNDNVHLIQHKGDILSFLKELKEPLSFTIQGEDEKAIVSAPPLPIEVFIIVDSKDEGYLNSLKTHLANLIRSKQISVWSLQDIHAGQEREIAIKKRLDSAEIILFLLSSDFLANGQCTNLTLQVMQRHNELEGEQLRTIPIILRECDWRQFEPLAKLEPFPKDQTPLATRGDKEAILTNLAEEIRKEAIKRQSKAVSANPNRTAS